MAFAGRVLGLCVLTVFLIAAAPGPSRLHQLVEQMRAASGEPYLYHLTSIARQKRNGADATTQTDFFGLAFTTQTCDGAICRGTYFDGKRLFTVNMNGTALPDLWQERYLRAIRTVNSGYMLSPDFAREGGVLSDLGSIVSKGTSYRALGVAMNGMPSIIALVDPKTFLVSAVRDWHGDIAFENRDYRRVGPLMLPFVIYSDGLVAQEYASREISAAPFVAPHGLAATFNSAPAEIPMSKRSRAPIIPCTLSGVHTSCLIDTGNSGLSISIELAERLHLPSVGEFEVSGLGQYATEVVRTGPLAAGNVEFPVANYIVLHDIRPNGYDVVLGADALAANTLSIDYQANSVVFQSGDAPVTGSTMPLSFLNFVPVVPISLTSTRALLAVDTGDESTINLSYDYYREHSDLFSFNQSREVNGVGGSSVEMLGEIASVQLGQYRVESQEIGTTRTLHATGEGHLGAGFLSHFRVVLDYAHERMGLTPRSGDPSVHTTSQPPPRP